MCWAGVRRTEGWLRFCGGPERVGWLCLGSLPGDRRQARGGASSSQRASPQGSRSFRKCRGNRPFPSSSQLLHTVALPYAAGRRSVRPSPFWRGCPLITCPSSTSASPSHQPVLLLHTMYHNVPSHSHLFACTGRLWHRTTRRTPQLSLQAGVTSGKSVYLSGHELPLPQIGADITPASSGSSATSRPGEVSSSGQ